MVRNIRIETAPTATAATTAARLLVRFSGLASVGEPLLVILIDEATAAAERLTGRPLARATYRELLSGNGTEILRLGRAPLESVTSVAVAGSALDSTAYGRVDTLQPNLRRLSGTSGFYEAWPLCRRASGFVESQAVAGLDAQLNIEVVYTAGYWLPSMSGSAPAGAHVLPIGLESAVQRLLVDLLDEEQRGSGVASIKKGDREIRYVEGVGPISSWVADALEREAVVYS